MTTVVTENIVDVATKGLRVTRVYTKPITNKIQVNQLYSYTTNHDNISQLEFLIEGFGLDRYIDCMTISAKTTEVKITQIFYIKIADKVVLQSCLDLTFDVGN